MTRAYDGIAIDYYADGSVRSISARGVVIVPDGHIFFDDEIDRIISSLIAGRRPR